MSMSTFVRTMKWGTWCLTSSWERATSVSEKRLALTTRTASKYLSPISAT
eukprot:CAMPEP_0180666328 /NCGR_PEP_ID=MMETSP1037_2-20121125/61761_1 /TAXON_ID=632150 /ORGANISM="Azadinium spinosum, Strain 3D9" /LENGTH=49 /DNA_ID=CAMNT_0022694839 /DNA_START=91 /DNA_END=240 /DNA_ORIENTATION=+